MCAGLSELDSLANTALALATRATPYTYIYTTAGPRAQSLKLKTGKPRDTTAGAMEQPLTPERPSAGGHVVLGAQHRREAGGGCSAPLHPATLVQALELCLPGRCRIGGLCPWRQPRCLARRLVGMPHASARTGGRL